jgi:phage recombination protein Bet
MNELKKHEGGALALAEDELIEVLSSSLYPGASLASIKMVISYCRAAGYDVMQKPVHIVPMWDSKANRMRDVIMPGVGLYRTNASRLGCAGVTEPEFGPDVTQDIGGHPITFPAWCRVTVKRRQASGDVDEFTAKEFWLENYAVRGGKEKSVAPNAMWAKRPYGQIAKCAEAQALRKAFPEGGSQPAAEEMEGKSIDSEYIDSRTGEVSRGPVPREEKQALPGYTDGEFAEKLPEWRGIVQSGRKTAAALVAMLGTKKTLTDGQIEQIKALEDFGEDVGADGQGQPETVEG